MRKKYIKFQHFKCHFKCYERSELLFIRNKNKVSCFNFQLSNGIRRIPHKMMNKNYWRWTWIHKDTKIKINRIKKKRRLCALNVESKIMSMKMNFVIHSQSVGNREMLQANGWGLFQLRTMKAEFFFLKIISLNGKNDLHFTWKTHKFIIIHLTANNEQILAFRLEICATVCLQHFAMHTTEKKWWILKSAALKVPIMKYWCGCRQVRLPDIMNGGREARVYCGQYYWAIAYFLWYSKHYE